MIYDKIKNNTVLASVIVVVFIVGIFLLAKINVPQEEALVPAVDSSLKTITDPTSGVTFQYPEKLATTYINTVDWPPQVQVIEGEFACMDAGEEVVGAGEIKEKVVNGRTYCVTTITEGAAGSIYTLYAYAATVENKTLYFTFTIRATQCENYSEPEKSECTSERTKFNIDKVVDQIVRTAHF